ncbi:MAG: hypothetical protein IKA72_00665 [Clostridia bacterium]|nr:hypothetical protein [Clostridia bacterium]
MDVLYEECAVNKKAVRDEKIYKVMNIGFYICTFIAIVALFNTINNIPLGSKPSNLTPEQIQAYEYAQTMFFLGLGLLFSFGSGAFLLFLLKRRININYDYTFVSGELRIVKVFNVNRRKLLARIQPEEILQVGDTDSESYMRLLSNTMNKQVFCTPNIEPMEGKFFMYVHANTVMGKKLYVLECREELLVNILKFVKRGTLEHDYVMQEKKQRN